MATRLFVGNLPTTTKEYDLHAAFSSYGEIKNVDLKSKSSVADENNKFAFVTISGSNCDIESCIKHFSSEDFNGQRLYVTRARESFLERLQRERLEAQQKETEKVELGHKKAPIIKLGNKLNPCKRKIDNDTSTKQKALNQMHTFGTKNVIQNDYESDAKKTKTVLEIPKKSQDHKLKDTFSHIKRKKEIDASANQKASDQTNMNVNTENGDGIDVEKPSNILEKDKKKQESEMKRMKAMIMKTQEFKQKQMIVKSGLTDVDKVSNKKIIFSDNEEETPKAINSHSKKSAKTDKKNTLFDDDDDDGEEDNNELNFEIKKQFEGKKGQKVLDLQSRYKSDKRFVLDERFIEEEEREETAEAEDQIEVNQIDEKDKQLNILQDVLGVAIKRKIPEEERDAKKKPKIGMLRFDPSQPEHAKFLAPVADLRQQFTKKSKSKTKDKQIDKTETQEQKQEEPRPEVSKEQFYKVSETLKEAIAQPTSFSLRSLFQNTEHHVDEEPNEEANYISLKPPKKSKIKNPLEPEEKNPFVYDSSESDAEEIEEEKKTEVVPAVAESKAVWRECFFFGQSDQRFEEGLAFFNSANESEAQKERRELKSLMKKRIYNKERKNQMQMFQKKIGGRKKTMKKSFRKKS